MTLVDTGEDTHDRRAPEARARLRAATSSSASPTATASRDVDIGELIAFHRAHGRARDGDRGAAAGPLRRARDRTASACAGFEEKPHGDGGWINGGFFVLSPEVVDYIDGDATVWEREPLERLAAEGQLAAYQHDGFWQPMDTLRDKSQLEELWALGRRALEDRGE